MQPTLETPKFAILAFGLDPNVTSALNTLKTRVGLINRSALAPVSAAGTGANALRLIPKSNLYQALINLLPDS